MEIHARSLGWAGVELTAGDVLTLPKGWSGRWDILETVRKLYVTAAV